LKQKLIVQNKEVCKQDFNSFELEGIKNENILSLFSNSKNGFSISALFLLEDELKRAIK
jgi:hypothetical protein